MADLDTMIRGALWAKVLAEDELDLVVAESFERRVAPGGYVLRRGETANHWFGVIEGLIKMSVSLPDGRQSTFTGVPSGGWAGEGSLLDPGPWRYDGIAVRDTRVACVPRRTYERLVATSLPFNRYLLSHLNARLSLFISLAEFDRLYGPTARVARCLSGLFNPHLYPRADPFIQLNQEEIGLLAGVSRQRANLALHELGNLGLLRIEFGGVMVLDLEGLSHFHGPTKVSGRERQARAAGVDDRSSRATMAAPVSAAPR